MKQGVQVKRTAPTGHTHPEIWRKARPAAPARPKAAPSVSAQAAVGVAPWADAWRYPLDWWQRSVLFLDTLRRRADNLLTHERAGLPPLLDFKYEMILDARRFARPANYALLRITEIGDERWQACVKPDRAQVIIVDPRAGHGPGIGGFKRPSEVGMALHQDHPAYFVSFFPEPVASQTLADVLHALRRFVEAVAARHPGKPLVLYGNCQGGWAVTLLAADCEGLAGPVVLNGSPLSYWAGESGVSPMRVSGGLLGGAWLAELAADLGDGRFDARRRLARRRLRTSDRVGQVEHGAEAHVTFAGRTQHFVYCLFARLR